MNDFPFAETKIQVCQSVNELKELMAKFPTTNVCVYLGYKDEAGWAKSTSRVYFNQVLANFLYIPLNLVKDNLVELKSFYQLAMAEKRIVAINQTQPHKDNPVLKEVFSNRQNLPINIDTILKDDNDQLVPLSLNGEAFTSWYLDEVGDYLGKNVIIMGVGGAGEPIARKIASLKPIQLQLVDIADKSELASDLERNCSTKYFPNLKQVENTNQSNLVLINCTGKEGTLDETGILEFLTNNVQSGDIFVDIRPHLDLEIVKKAAELGWESYTGYGMNARNDYVLLEKIGVKIGTAIMSFQEFAELVKKAS